MNYVIEFNKNLLEDIDSYISSKSTQKRDLPSGILYRIGETNITIYNTGKILIQGKNAEDWNRNLSEHFNLSASKPAEKSSKLVDLKNIQTYPRIGSDESGKGDFFGPIVTAAFMVTSHENERKLLDLGVTDSKKISDKKILEVAPAIKKLGYNVVIRIGPEKYNELYEKMQNVNKILGWSHARAIENILLKHECNLAIADQFGDEKVILNSMFKLGKKIDLIQTPKAERDIAVASASVLAREAFIYGMRDLSIKHNLELPYGAGDNVISKGIEFARKQGFEALNQIAKIHFKTLENIKNNL